jgi:hypothetical protein
VPSHFLLDRRTFLAHAGTGLGAIALTSLLTDQKLLADDPLVSKKTHHAAKAKRVLTIFCSGAVSHVDTFDYKPELVQRDGQPLPGGDTLVTFQGAQGNLVKPLWPERHVVNADPPCLSRR